MMLLQRDKISLNESQPSPIEMLRNISVQINYINMKLSQLEKRIEESQYYPEIIEGKDYSNEMAFIQKKLMELEKKIDERIPERVVTESMFKRESHDAEELVEKIVSQVQPVVEKPLLFNTGLTPVESKRIEKILHVLERHEKLSSVELSELTGLSRTRCNEYFKLMEKNGLVEAVSNGKEKSYVLRK